MTYIKNFKKFLKHEEKEPTKLGANPTVEEQTDTQTDSTAQADQATQTTTPIPASVENDSTVIATRKAVADSIANRDKVVAISPIVGGHALKGPADRMLTELGHESSALGVARLYKDIASTLIIDTVDANLKDAIEREGMRCIVTNTVMSEPKIAGEPARTTLDSIAG